MSSEFRDDGRLVHTALEALGDEPVQVVATTLDTDPASFDAPPNARVERFVPHGPLLDRAACVVCHGGMGITQKALARGVPAASCRSAATSSKPPGTSRSPAPARASPPPG